MESLLRLLSSYVLSSIFILGTDLAFAQQRTTAVYSDWTLSCAIASDAHKSCGLVQVQKSQGQSSADSQIGVGRQTTDEPFLLFIRIRSDSWIPNGVKLIAGGSVISTTFKWCAPTGCVAAAGLTDNDIRSLRAQRQPGRIAYRSGSQADVSIPVSFNGFNEALDALQKE
jgi:invasion protein IalB